MASYTQVKVLVLPNCDFCKMQGKTTPAKYDFATNMGPWAYGCQEHFDLNHRFDTLGLGKGQELILDTED